MYIVDEEQIENIYDNINGLTINSFEGKTVIDPRIDIGDILIIDNKKVIYQGEMSLAGRFIVDIKSKISIKQKQETTVRRESQKVVNRRVQSRIDQVEGSITTLVEEIHEEDGTSKISKIEQKVDSISQKVENIEDLTNTVEGIKTITLENCVEGDLLELHIFGNNTVFDYLYTSDDIFPEGGLYPYGDSRIEVINFPDNSEEGISEIYELGITEVLRQNSEVCDEFILEKGQAKVIRRVNKSGSTKAKESTQNLGELKIRLKEGTNIINIKNYTAKLSAKFAIKNNYTEVFATKAEVSSSITQTAKEINLEVKKKVDENEIISKINQSAEQISIQAEKINFNGAISANGNFKIDTEGNLEAHNGKFNGGEIYLEDEGNSNAADARLLIQNKLDDSSYSYMTSEQVLIRDNEFGMAEMNTQRIMIVNSSLTNGAEMHSNGSLEVFSDNYVTFYARANETFADNFKYKTITQYSLENIKKNIEPYKEKALEIIKNGDIYIYNLKSEKDNDKKHIGFIIGNTYKTPKEIIAKDKDGIDTYSMTSIMWKAIQELLKKNEDLEKRVKELEGK